MINLFINRSVRAAGWPFYITFCVPILLNTLASAQNKGLDQTFGDRGIAATSTYTNKKFKASSGLVIQPDGKILISGNFIARYKANGTPDSSFGTSGFVVPPYSSFSNAIALLPNGKILSIGQPDTGCSYIARLLPNGIIDTSFGTNGISKNRRLNPWLIGIQPDGKIIVIGNGCGIISSSADSVTVGRFLPDGNVDTTFGKRGFSQGYLGFYGGSITSFGLTADGRIAMGGVGYDNNRNRSVIVFRFLPNGELDTSLGSTGRIFPFNALYCHSWAMQPDGRMLMTIANLNDEDVTRLNVDGSLDTSFGTNGYMNIKGLATLSMLPLIDGRILCGGTLDGDFAVARLKANGKGLDSSFGIDGTISTDVTGYWEDRIGFIALQNDNRVIACGVGALDNNTPPWVYLTRYNANATTDVKPAEKQSATGFSVVPNPARTQISMLGVMLDQLASIEVFAADGSEMKHTLSPKSSHFSVADFTAGVYVLRAVFKSGAIEYKRFAVAP